MTKRRAITLSTKVAVLQSQAICGCGCGEALGENIIWDHVFAHALGGSDDPENIRAVRVDCNDRITNGTKATTAGSTKHVVAKSKRIRKKLAGDVRPKHKIPSRGFQKPPAWRKSQWPSRRVAG